MKLSGLAEKEPRRFSIWERSCREKGAWTQMTPSVPATSLRGQTRSGEGFRDRVREEMGGEGRESGGERGSVVVPRGRTSGAI